MPCAWSQAAATICLTDLSRHCHPRPSPATSGWLSGKDWAGTLRQMRTPFLLSLLYAVSVTELGCLVPNDHYKAPPDQAVTMDLLGPPDLKPCPTYVPGGGGGRDRPEIFVPGGQGQIGIVATKVSDFYLDVFDVTVAAYRDCPVGTCSKLATSTDCNWTDPVGGKENHPINCVTFVQAQAFCTWAKRRLPTEAECGYAAGEGKSTYPWGEGDPQNGAGAQLCWNRSIVPCGDGGDGGTCDLGTCPVGLFDKTLSGERNCGGAADLAGTVWQWLDTEYKEPYIVPEPICKSICSIRGGSWSDAADGMSNFRAAFRNDVGDGIGYASRRFGFRCARTP